QGQGTLDLTDRTLVRESGRSGPRQKRGGSEMRLGQVAVQAQRLCFRDLCTLERPGIVGRIPGYPLRIRGRNLRVRDREVWIERDRLLEQADPGEIVLLVRSTELDLGAKVQLVGFGTARRNRLHLCWRHPRLRLPLAQLREPLQSGPVEGCANGWPGDLPDQPHPDSKN